MSGQPTGQQQNQLPLENHDRPHAVGPSDDEMMEVDYQ